MKKYENFCASLANLKDIYDYEEPYSNIVLTGMVALYEICFEQSWKAIRELMEKSGAAVARTGSPKQILKTAYEMGMIEDEAIWLRALQARNLATHAYNQAVASEIVKAVKKDYYPMFCALKAEIDENWI